MCGARHVFVFASIAPLPLHMEGVLLCKCKNIQFSSLLVREPGMGTVKHRIGCRSLPSSRGSRSARIISAFSSQAVLRHAQEPSTFPLEGIENPCYIPSQKGKERSPDVDASPEHPEEDQRFSCRLFSQHHSSEGYRKGCRVIRRMPEATGGKLAEADRLCWSPTQCNRLCGSGTRPRRDPSDRKRSGRRAWEPGLICDSAGNSEDAQKGAGEAPDEVEGTRPERASAGNRTTGVKNNKDKQDPEVSRRHRDEDGTDTGTTVGNVQRAGGPISSERNRRRSHGNELRGLEMRMDGQLIHCGKGPEVRRPELDRRRGNKSSQGLQACECVRKKPGGMRRWKGLSPRVTEAGVAVPEMPEMEGNGMADMPEDAEGGNEQNGPGSPEGHVTGSDGDLREAPEKLELRRKCRNVHGYNMSGASGRRPEVLLSAVLATPQLGRPRLDGGEMGIEDSGGNHVTPDGAGQVPEGVQSDLDDAGSNQRKAGGNEQNDSARKTNGPGGPEGRNEGVAIMGLVIL
ncbi:hypothetical protein B0H11DRAFT_1925826 [Mycena galericulata]|nr:hypothetical protein B0H11DRAFT_1925826 [Mycena galericulata]